MFPVLILKTGALGDVLRTTSILPGFAERHPGLTTTWVTAPGAVDLVAHHPLVGETLALDPGDEGAVRELSERLSGREFARVLSLDDELPMCRLASRVADPSAKPGVLSGAYLADGSQTQDGARAYTPDVAPWFDMGLLSVHGKAEADRRKVQNQASHAAIYAGMFGIRMGEPELPLEPVVIERARGRLASLAGRRLVGLNTGSGGRWESKKLSVERTVALALELEAARPGQLGFVLLGGPEEAERNAELTRELESRVALVDTGTGNGLLEFAGLVGELDLLVTSDSLALHVAVARKRPVLCFFAPTSAAEIELYGRGEKVLSTAADYCSYAKDADTKTLTVERLLAPALRCLDGAGSREV